MNNEDFLKKLKRPNPEDLLKKLKEMRFIGEICDWCGKPIGEGDYISVYRHDKDGRVIGGSNYCEECWNKYHRYPKGRNKEGGKQ